MYGAELSEQGVDNLYDATHYPGLNRDAHPKTTMTGMLPEDPFQYPPQFLLLPRMVRSMTHDYATVRVVWFALQTTLFVTIVAWLSLWVGGREGRRATTLMPLVLTAFPTLHALQYGQFHLTAVALGVGSLIAFEERRPRLGGAMLAVATLSKIFPGILLVLLFVQRRWHDLAWTTSFIALISFVAWAVLGQAPFAAFVEYQVPRLASGEAFAFGETWPEVRHLLIAGNQGFVGLMAKLVELGMASFDGETTLWASRGYGLVVLILAALLGLSEEGAGRHCRAVSWLAILGLASLASAGAWGDYVPLTGIWLLTLVSATSRSATLTHGACWIFFFLLVGTTPVGTWAPATPLIALSLVGAMLAIGLYGGALLSSVGALASTIKLAPFWKREQRVQSR